MIKKVNVLVDMPGKSYYFILIETLNQAREIANLGEVNKVLEPNKYKALYYLVHIAAEKLILFLQSLYKALWSNDTCFLLL